MCCMKRRYTAEAWRALGERMQEVSKRMGGVRRSPLERQAGKGRVKRAILRKAYGERGQA